MTPEQIAEIERAYQWARQQGWNQCDSCEHAAEMAQVTIEQVYDYLIEKTKAPGELF